MTSDHADEDLMTRRQVAFLFRVTWPPLANERPYSRPARLRDTPRP